MDPKLKDVSRAKVVTVIILHSMSAISVTLANKAFMLRIECPIALLTSQVIVQTVLLGGIGALTGHVVLFRRHEAWKSVVPLSLIRLIGIYAKTLCLAAVDATFYQVSRGLLLPFTVALSVLILRPRPHISAYVYGSISIVLLGFAIGFASDYSGKLSSARGLGIGILSSLITAVESIAVKYFVTKADENMLQLAYMSCALQAVAFAALLWTSKELQVITSSMSTFQLYLQGSMLSGVTNTFLVAATFAQISITSPITHTVAAAARGVVQSLLAAGLFKEPLTVGRSYSMVVLTLGTALYCFVKDMERSQQSTTTEDSEMASVETLSLFDTRFDDSKESSEDSDKSFGLCFRPS